METSQKNVYRNGNETHMTSAKMIKSKVTGILTYFVLGYVMFVIVFTNDYPN